MRRCSSSGSPNSTPKPSMDLAYRLLGGGPLGLAMLAARGQDLLERAELEDRGQREEPDAEAEDGDGDLLADGVGRDGRARGRAAEHLDQERLLDAGAAGGERHDG